MRALPAAIQPHIEYTGRDLPAKSHLCDMSHPAEIHDAADPTHVNIPATPLPSDAGFGSDSDGTVRENETRGADGDEGARTADVDSQREEYHDGGSGGGENLEPSLEQRVLSSNLIATASVSSCYLLSTISTGGKIVGGKCAAALGTIATQAISSSKHTTQAIGTTNNDTPADSKTLHEELAENAAHKPDAQARDSSAASPVDLASVEAYGDQQALPDDCITQGGTSNAELESTTDRSPKDTPAFSTSWLLSLAGAVSKGLASRFSGNAEPGDTTAEADLPIEHRLDRFLHAPADSSDRPPLVE